MKNPDEDIAYGEWKQRQIDNDRLTPRPHLVIGSALPQGERIQKSVRKDPHPEILFAVDPDEMTGLEKTIWIILFVSVVSITALNPFGWSW